MPSSAATSESPEATTSRRGLNAALWIAQILLALAFGMAGVMKLGTPLAELGQKMSWVRAVPGGLVRFIGASELAGSLGLILPAATRVRPGLTPLAASGLITIMVLAIPVHLVHGELSVVGVPIAIGALAAFVAWGRFRKLPIAPRNPAAR